MADESVPLLWGGFRMTAAIDTGPGTADGVIFALGDWFGGYALYAVGGAVHFTFARSADALELAAPSPSAPGRHELGVLYEVGEGGAPGRMVLLVDDVEVDETGVEGTLPLAAAARRRGAAARARQRVPRLAALHAAGSLQGHGAPAADRHAGLAAARPGATRCAPPCTPTDGSALRRPCATRSRAATSRTS